MYDAFLIIHSWLRWVVLALALVATVTAFSGWLGKREWTPGQKRIDTFLIISADVQLLVGMVLYVFLSPVTHAAFSHFGDAMKDTQLRFFAMEHVGLMVLAIIGFHVGHALSKKAELDIAKYKRAAISFGIAVVLLVVGIPWPGLAVGRPLLRF